MARKAKRARRDPNVEEIRGLLERRYCSEHPQAEITVTRMNSGAIWVRIIDPDFRGRNRVERDKLPRPLLDELSEDALQELHILHLITPEERATSWLSPEFDNPRPSSI